MASTASSVSASPGMEIRGRILVLDDPWESGISKAYEKPLPKKILAMRTWNLRSQIMISEKKPQSSGKTRLGPGAFPAVNQ